MQRAHIWSALVNQVSISHSSKHLQTTKSKKVWSPVITTLESLDKSALIKILTEPKNALTKQFKKLFRIEGVELDFRVEALNAIADKALERKSGARGLRSILEIALKETMFDLPTIRNLEKVVIDDGVIKDNKAPYLIFSKDEKQRQSK